MFSLLTHCIYPPVQNFIHVYSIYFLTCASHHLVVTHARVVVVELRMRIISGACPFSACAYVIRRGLCQPAPSSTAGSAAAQRERFGVHNRRKFNTGWAVSKLFAYPSNVLHGTVFFSNQMWPVRQCSLGHPLTPRQRHAFLRVQRQVLYLVWLRRGSHS